jgi:hypothetical protein
MVPAAMTPLSLHPAEPPAPAVAALVGEAEVRGGDLRLAFRLEGAIPAIRIPPRAPPVRADGLWRHTCFEAFLRADDGPSYVELNFSPSGAWAAYRFEGYRAGSLAPGLPVPPDAYWRRADVGLALDATVPIAALLPGPVATLRIALAAVIEDASGTITHWALRHPADRPDFHHPEGFVLALPGVSQPR